MVAFVFKVNIHMVLIYLRTMATRLPFIFCLPWLLWLTKVQTFEVSDTVHLFSMDERKPNLMHLLYIFIVAVGGALHVSGVFAHRQES
jgi:hypothetical protein